MTATFARHGRSYSRRAVRHLVWLIPAGVGIFFGLGLLVEWLWRMTVADIFGFRVISFWQAWGLILLAQILFKANIQPTMRTRSRRSAIEGCGQHLEKEPGRSDAGRPTGQSTPR